MTSKVKFTALSLSDLSKAIGNIGRAGVKLNTMIQVAAVNAVYQSVANRNITPMNELYAAVGKAMRRDSLVRWLESHGNCAWITADKAFKFYDAGKQYDDEGYATLLTMPWQDAKAENKAESIYDVAEQVERLIAKIEKSIEKTHEVKHGDLLDDLKLLLREYNAREFVAAAEGAAS